MTSRGKLTASIFTQVNSRLLKLILLMCHPTVTKDKCYAQVHPQSSIIHSKCIHWCEPSDCCASGPNSSWASSLNPCITVSQWLGYETSCHDFMLFIWVYMIVSVTGCAVKGALLFRWTAINLLLFWTLWNISLTPKPDKTSRCLSS